MANGKNGLTKDIGIGVLWWLVGFALINRVVQPSVGWAIPVSIALGASVLCGGLGLGLIKNPARYLPMFLAGVILALGVIPTH